MRVAQSFLALLGTLVAVFATLYFVLFRNLSTGVYSVNTDSISIPLFEGLATVVIVFVFIGTSLLLPNRSAYRFTSLVLTLITLLIVSDAAWFWAIPKHYEITIAYGLLFVVCLILGGRRFAKSNSGYT